LAFTITKKKLLNSKDSTLRSAPITVASLLLWSLLTSVSMGIAHLVRLALPPLQSTDLLR